MVFYREFQLGLPVYAIMLVKGLAFLMLMSYFSYSLDAVQIQIVSKIGGTSCYVRLNCLCLFQIHAKILYLQCFT